LKVIWVSWSVGLRRLLELLGINSLPPFHVFPLHKLSARNKTAVTEFQQKAPQLAFCSAQVRVMLESRKGCSSFRPWLLGINLPRMHVKQVALLPLYDFPYANSEKRAGINRKYALLPKASRSA